MNKILAGIDVSAKTLDVAVEPARGPARLERFDNDERGHRALVRRLTKAGRQSRVVLEATGVYHLDLALTLHAHARIGVMTRSCGSRE